MRIRIAALSWLVITTSLWAQPQAGFADMVERIQDGVVNIMVTQEISNREDPLQRFFRGPRGRREAPQNSGTGFIISSDGYIVTNKHVVADAEEVKVLLGSGKTYDAKVIGRDDSLDIAVLKIDAENLTHLPVGDSDKMRIGDTVLALGFPLQLGFSVTSGIVSGIGRNMRTDTFDVASYLQTDADITFGNSGGPLVNTKGEVIAINTLIVSRGETYGFSIPSNLFINSVAQLREHGRVKRGALGVSIGNLDEESKDYYKLEHGALINGVTEGMPAAEIGLKAGDIILAVNGHEVKSNQDVITRVASLPPGEKVKLKILSNGRKLDKTLTLGDRDTLLGRNTAVADSPKEEVSSDETNLGFSVVPLDRELRTELEVPAEIEGVLVETVDPDSLAAEKGVRRGSILTHIDKQPVREVGDVGQLLADLRKGQATAVRMMERDGENNYRSRMVFLRKN